MDDSVAELRKAMKGLGTNDTKLINHMAVKRSNKDMQELLKKYHATHNRELIKDIVGDTGGDYQRTLVSLATDQALLDARLVRASVKGIGTNEDKLNEVLCTRTGEELKAMSAAYEVEFKGRTALADVQDDSGGLVKKLYTTLLTSGRPTPPDSDLATHAMELYDAGTNKWGTNEDKFIAILGGHSKDYVDKLNKVYEAKHGHNLAWVVTEEFSFDIAAVLKVLATPSDEYFAKLLKKAMVGIGTDETLLTRVIVTQRHYPGRMAGIAKAYVTPVKEKKEHIKKKKKEKKDSHKKKKKQLKDTTPMPLRDWIKSETSGDYRAVLLAIFDNNQ